MGDGRGVNIDGRILRKVQINPIRERRKEN